MAYKQQPKSPMLKALKGNQGKLPQHLQDAIKAAPESPAKQTKEPYQRQMGPLDKYNPHKPGSAESKKYRKDYNIQHQEAQMGKEKAGFPAPKVSKTKTSPAKQTTAGEFAHKQSIKDKEMGKSTKAVDKVKAAYDAMTTDKTYAEAKKGYRKAAKEAYDAKSPAKVKDPVTGSKVKGYAKSDRKVDNARMKQDLKESKKAKLKTAKEDGKVTRLERKGIRESQKDMRNKKVNETNTKFQKQKVKDKAHKERTRVRNVARKASDAVKVGLSEGEASSRVGKALDKANRRVDRAKSKAARKTRSK